MRAARRADLVPLRAEAARPVAARARGRPPFPLPAPAELELLLFGGQGGVGKTTCAAAAAIAIARADPSRPVLLISTDPAHSLCDALEIEPGEGDLRLPGGPRNLRVREPDAPRLFARRRELIRREVEELFTFLGRGLSGGLDASLDRRVAASLIELAPPGVDELLGMLEVMEATGGGAVRPRELVVVDTAPTGHALRLLALPGEAHRWVRELLAALERRRPAGRGTELARGLLDLARGLRRLHESLADPRRARFVAVARAEALPRAETGRLLAALRRLSIAPGTLLVNALTPPGCSRCRDAARAEEHELAALRRLCLRRAGGGCAIITAPAEAPPPRGWRSLERWARTWTL
jgi:arsenite-transporting ATPase